MYPEVFPPSAQAALKLMPLTWMLWMGRNQVIDSPLAHGVFCSRLDERWLSMPKEKERLHNRTLSGFRSLAAAPISARFAPPPPAPCVARAGGRAAS